MSGFAFEDTMLREPNLWVPGAPPDGPVTVDTTNDLTRGCAGYFLGRDAGRPIIHNLMSDNTVDSLVPRSYSAAFPKGVGSDKGIVYDSSNESNAFYWDSDVANPRWIPSNHVTIMAVYKQFSYASAGNSVIGRCDTGSSTTTYYSLRLYSDKTRLTVRVANGSTYTAEFAEAVPLNEWHVLTGVANLNRGASIMEIFLYLDGIEVAYLYTGVNSGLWTGAETGTNFRLGNGKIDDTSRGYDGQIAMGAMWADRPLSPSEVVSMSDDPYQFLMPA